MIRAVLIFLAVAALLALLLLANRRRDSDALRSELPSDMGERSAPSPASTGADGRRSANARAAVGDPNSPIVPVSLATFLPRWSEVAWAAPKLEPDLLASLREFARDHVAARLLDAAEALPPGDPEACLLLLATAWARELDASTDARLRAFASTMGEPLDAHDRAGLAAVHALALGGRRSALGEVAGELADQAWAAPQGEPVFPGLSSVRVWFALRDADADPELFAAGLEADRSRYRVTSELWALAAREAPEVWVPAIFERSLDGDEHAREGLAGLQDPRWFAELAGLVDAPWEGDSASWVHRDALRGLVAMGSISSLARLELELRGDNLRRENALEALRSWRCTSSWGRVVALGEQLANDAGAHEAWLHGVQRAWDRLRFRREGNPERTTAEAALERAFERGAIRY